MTKRPLAENLIRLRKTKGLTQGEAAIKLGKSIKTYQAWEEDRAEPQLKMIKIIMEAFGLKETDMYPFAYNEDFWKAE